MTGKEVFNMAMENLGYSENPSILSRAKSIINKVYYDLHRIINGNSDFKPLESLSETVNLPLKTIISAMVSGVAERIALGEGDGELQQYFALDYDREKAKLNTQDKIHDVLP